MINDGQAIKQSSFYYVYFSIYAGSLLFGYGILSRVEMKNVDVGLFEDHQWNASNYVVHKDLYANWKIQCKSKFLD